MTDTIRIRTAVPVDAEALLDIYRPYVLSTAITFEYDVPTVEDFRQRIVATLSRYPYLVAEDAHGKPVGYACAGAFKTRAAYDWAAEVSVYVDARHHRKGIGQALYETIEDTLKRQNVTNLNACITFAEVEDGLHHNDSMRFHQRLGYELVAHFHQCGYKFDRWWDMVWMEKLIAPHQVPQPKFIPFSRLR